MQNEYIEARARFLAEYVISQNCTIRAAAKKFYVSKSTVHKDLSERLRDIDYSLYLRVKEILDRNKAVRHIRGGEATRARYAGGEAASATLTFPD